MKAKDWKASQMMVAMASLAARFAAFSGGPARKGGILSAHKARCPVCGTLGPAGKGFCSAEHARWYRENRRSRMLRKKNGIKGARSVPLRVMQDLDRQENGVPGWTHRHLGHANG